MELGPGDQSVQGRLTAMFIVVLALLDCVLEARQKFPSVLFSVTSFLLAVTCKNTYLKLPNFYFDAVVNACITIDNQMVPSGSEEESPFQEFDGKSFD